MLPDHDNVEERPKFQTFVTWSFYACIVLIAYGILGRFDSLDQKQTAIETSISSLRLEVMTSLEKSKYLDKEVSSIQIQVNELRNQMLASAGKKTNIPREE